MARSRSRLLASKDWTTSCGADSRENCLYLVTGTPGTGKTSLAMQFLIEGARKGDRCLYITLSETRAEIDKVARSHGWDLTGVAVKELIPSETQSVRGCAAHGVQPVRDGARRDDARR